MLNRYTIFNILFLCFWPDVIFPFYFQMKIFSLRIKTAFYSNSNTLPIQRFPNEKVFLIKSVKKLMLNRISQQLLLCVGQSDQFNKANKCQILSVPKVFVGHRNVRKIISNNGKSCQLSIFGRHFTFTAFVFAKFNYS